MCYIIDIRSQSLKRKLNSIDKSKLLKIGFNTSFLLVILFGVINQSDFGQYFNNHIYDVFMNECHKYNLDPNKVGQLLNDFNKASTWR